MVRCQLNAERPGCGGAQSTRRLPSSWATRACPTPSKRDGRLGKIQNAVGGLKDALSVATTATAGVRAAMTIAGVRAGNRALRHRAACFCKTGHPIRWALQR